MQLYVGVTDHDWFQYLAAAGPDEVNFWQPGGSQGFRALSPGEPFLFKLKAPHNAIAGGGFFIRYTALPLTVAWSTFGVKNGAPDFETFAATIRGYRSDDAPNPTIGCVILTRPFFFAPENWVPVPENWHPNIVQGKTYDMQRGVGARLWQQVQDRLQAQIAQAERPSEAPVVAEELARYGAEYVAQYRLGQGSFRALVTDAYDRRCAFTGEKTLPALQASHIKPYAQSGPHRVSNGLLLRADLHQLFDRGYLTITSDHHIEVSRRIQTEFDNGDAYLALHGRRLQAVPDAPGDRPSPDFIAYHQDRVFAP